MRHLPPPRKTIARFLLAALVLCLTVAAQADDISIPTDADHPFDLTLGTLEGNGLNITEPMGLKPGDEVKIVNPEFDDGSSGWTAKGAKIGVTDLFGNRRAAMYGGTMSLSQSVAGLPVGIYLLLCSAYDEAREWNGTDTLQSYVFLNDSYQPMKNAYDDAVGYRNIYRLCDGQSTNNYYRMRADGRYAPTSGREWNQAIAMAEGLYVNGVTATITDGKADFGWTKTDRRGCTIVFDHFRLIYLSDDITLSAEARAALVSEYVTATYRARLSAMKQAMRTELATKRPHAPQAVAEAEKILATDEHGLTRTDELIDTILQAEDAAQRLALPFYELTLNSSRSGELEGGFSSLGIQTTDTIALKLSGTLSDDDLAALKTLKNLRELDLSETTLTVLPRSQFSGMNQLTWVTLPQQLETIDQRAFYDCIRLRDMALPATLRSIGNYAFQHCYSLDRVVIPENVTLGYSVYVQAGLRSLSLPSTLKTVPENICFECPDLIDIRFNGQEEIGDRAFGRCNALRRVTLPEGIKHLGSAFIECDELASASLPSTLIYQYGPFNKCPKLKDVTILAACPPFGGLFDLAPDMGHAGQMEGVTVRVPRISADAYQESLFAWRFGTIEPIDTLPQSITMNGTFTFNVPDGLPADYKPDVDLRMNLLYPNSGATEVTGLQTKGSLTVNGTSMFSTGHYQQLYSPYAMRSAKFHRSYHGPLYTTLVNNGQMRADEVTVLLRMYKNNWEFVTFPYDVRVGDISCTEGPMPLIIYGYDCKKRAEGTGQAWVQMTADSTLHAGQGYIWQTSIPNNEKRTYPYNTFQVNALQNANKPKFFRNGDVEVTLEKHNAEFAQNRSWNFIGNPYPSFFDIRAIETTAPITVWEYGERGGGGTYQAISPLDDDYILAPGQAFFIQCPLDHDNLVFHKEGRQHDLELQYEASRNLTRAAAAAQQRQVYNLVLTAPKAPEAPLSSPEGDTNVQQGNEAPSGAVGGASGAFDRTRFVINEAASLDYEPGRDAAKFASLGTETAELYTVRDGVRYAIDERPLADGTVRLGLSVPADGTYTISLGNAQQLPSPVGEGQGVGAITLIDLDTNTEVPLGGDRGAYTFTASAGTTEARFLVRLANAATGVTEIENRKSENRKYFDLQGRPVTNPQPGIYVRNNKKVIIRSATSGDACQSKK